MNMDINVVEAEGQPKATKAAAAVTPQIGKELLEVWGEKIASQFGVKLPGSPQVLGQGTRGTAFAIDGKTVLKLTNDESEAGAQAKLRDSPVEFAAHVSTVFSLGSTGYYGIVQERLTPPAPLWRGHEDE